MNFTFRYWWYIFSSIIRNSGRRIAINFAVAAVFALFPMVSPSYSLPEYVCLYMLIILIMFVIIALKALLMMSYKLKFYKIVNEKGYCMEAFNYYHQTYIQGKPVNENDYIEFAELYQKFGDYDSAIKVLNSIKVPEIKVSLRALYIFEYMTVAVAKGDTSLADDIWRLNQNFINSVISDPKSGVISNALHLVMIYADCIAGRYERAFRICEDFLNSKHIKKYKSYKENFLVLKIYLLKKLCRDSETNAAVIEFNNYVANDWKPLLEVTRTELRNDVEKAIRGELPV